MAARRTTSSRTWSGAAPGTSASDLPQLPDPQFADSADSVLITPEGGHGNPGGVIGRVRAVPREVHRRHRRQQARLLGVSEVAAAHGRRGPCPRSLDQDLRGQAARLRHRRRDSVNLASAHAVVLAVRLCLPPGVSGAYPYGGWSYTVKTSESSPTTLATLTSPSGQDLGSAHPARRPVRLQHRRQAEAGSRSRRQGLCVVKYLPGS